MTEQEKEILFQKGLDAGRQRQYDQSVNLFTLLCEETEDPKNLLFLGRSFHGLRKFAQAVQIFQSSLVRFGGSPELYFFLGRSLYACDQPQRAIIYLEKALKAGFGGAQSLGLLGSAYLKAKIPSRAVEVLGQAVEAMPSHKGVYIAYLNALVVRAVQLFHLGNYDLCRQMLEFLLKNGADSQMIHRYLASVWRELGHPDQALPHLNQALKEHPKDNILIFQKIEALFFLGQSTQARQELQKVRHLLPRGTNLISSELLEDLLPLQALQQGNLRRAIFFALKKLKRKPNDLETSLILAEAYRQLGQFSKAENHFKRARKQQKNQKEPNYGLLMVYWQQQRFQEAFQEATKLLKLDANDSIVRYYSALLRCRIGMDPQENVALLAGLIQKDAPDPYLFAALAEEYHKMGLDDLALPWLKRTLALNPEHKAALELFAKLLVNASGTDWKDYFIEYLNHRPHDEEILKAYIPQLIHFKEYEEAKKRLLDWIALGHRSEGALRSLAFVYRMRGNFQEAFLVYRDLIHKAPQKIEYISAIILCLFKIGKKDLALTFAQKAFLQGSPNAKIHYHMGQLYLACNDLEQARKSFNKALEIDTKHWPSVEKLAEIYERECDIPMAARYRKYATTMKNR